MPKYIKFIYIVFVVLVTFGASFSIYASTKNGTIYNCFTIIAGKNATSNKSVLIAHNEDDSGKNVFVYLNRINKKDKQILELKNGGIVSKTSTPLNLFHIEVSNADFGDVYMNEYGVVITSNACPSREDTPVLSNGGIGPLLRRLVARRAKSARDAVKIAGKLIEKYGYASSGRTYAIADSNEGWLLHIVNGKHWIAKRVPDNEVAVIANYYTIKNIYLKDKQNFLGSPDIISYAKKRGWFAKNKSDSEFDFAKVYSNPKNFKSKANILRQWRATNLLSDKKYKIDDRFPFSFIPRRDVRITDLFEVLRDHYEDTDYDLSNDYKEGSPNYTGNRTICTKSTQFSFVAVLRNDLPKELNNLIWLALRRPDTNAYSPFYFTSNTIPSGYSSTGLNSKMKIKASNAFMAYSNLSNIVDANYKDRIKKVKKQWRKFEKYAIKQIKKKRKEFTYLLKKNPLVGNNIISNFIHSLEYKRWFLTTELIDEFNQK
jgi:dipeptidase